MFRPTAYDPVKENMSYNDMSQNDIEQEKSSYSDENDTTNISKIYHYETSEDNEDEASAELKQTCCPEINRDLIVYKIFYLIFFGAVGALFPYLAVFYKQLWLSPHQVGILIGLRPFIQMCASPLWGILADTYNVSKWILLMSIGAWLASNYSISLVKPKGYEPGCDFNLTYLPLADDVDDQDFNWVRVEPIISKKNNVTMPGFPKTVDDHRKKSKDGKLGRPDSSNEDYTSDKIINYGYDENRFFNYGDDDELDSSPGEDGLVNKVEKSEQTSLYTADKARNNSESFVEDNRKKTEERNEIKNDEMKRKKSEIRAFARKSPVDKTRNQTIIRIIEQMFQKNNRKRIARDQAHAKRKASISKRKIRGRINAIEKRRAWRLHSSKAATSYERRKERTIETAAQNNVGHSVENSEFGEENSNAYLEDVLQDNQQGEFFVESILPNQRILAKEALKEEFDSLKSAEGMLWPIVSKAGPTNSSQVRNQQGSADTKKVFNMLLAITIFGTILSSPAATLSDTATLQTLGDDKYRYGQQRLWGAFGWGLGAFVVGAIVSLIQDIAPCADQKHIDYILSFHVYAVAMGLAFVCALFFKFEPVSDTSYRESFWEATKLFFNCQHGCFILTLLCAGASMGFTHTFLFWHLHDMGGSQFLFSIVAAVQCISEVFMYFVSGYLILKIGCDSVLYIGLLANVLRLFTYSVITQPYFSVLLEVLQGISSASIWTAAVCYVGLNEGVQVTLQAMLHGIYWGLGHGGGGMLGGIVVSNLGSNASFIIFGICCIVNLAILLIMKYWKKLFELLSGYTSVETIPSGTYILVEAQRSSARH